MQEPKPLVSIPEKHILQIMLRLFKKWRLVRRLRKECLGHIGKQGDGFVLREGTVWVSKGAFAQQIVEHIWRARFWSEASKTEKLHQIHSILDSCIAEKFIDSFQHEDGRRFIKTSLTGEDFCGFTDFLEFFLSKYRSVATILIIPIVTFMLGFFGPSILKKLIKPPQLVYQASKPAEVSQPQTTQEQSSKGQDTRTGSTERRMSRKEPKPAAPSTFPSPISQDCGGGNCAASVGQQGGITGQVFVGIRQHLLVTDTQLAAITEAMNQFDGHKAIIIVNGNAQDAASFSQRLATALRAAKMTAEVSSGMAFSEDGSASLPVQVQYGDNDAEAGKALTKALFDNHVLPGSQIGFHYYQGKPGQLMITVTPPNP